MCRMLPSWVKAEWLIHIKASSFIDRWSTCHWTGRRQWEMCYPRCARLQGNWLIKSWSVLFSACSEPILKTWLNSHQIHPASAGTGTCHVSEKEHFSGMRQNNPWVGVRRAWQKERNFCLIKFPLCYYIKKNITHFMPWKMIMSDLFLVDRNCYDCDSCRSTVISDIFLPWCFILGRRGDV